MKRFSPIDRRLFLVGGASLALGGCDRIDQSKSGQNVFDMVNDASYKAQRALIGADRLAPEFAEADISKYFKPNGSIDPKEPAYLKLVADKFASWKLKVDGLVDAPRSYSLADLRALPSRTQITRHDCVEGWSCIGKWKGALLSTVLDDVKPKPEARYVVFHCIDSLGPDETQGPANDQSEATGGSLDATHDSYYETIDFNDARHPQTILAYDMNDQPLGVAHGAPLRVRIERQLGYKMAKYIMRIELVRDFTDIGRGKGGYWEDRGYDWYAGI